MVLLYQKDDGPPTDTRSIDFPPAPESRNLMNPYLPGTKSFTKRVNEWQPPNPLTTKPSGNLMYDVGAAAPIAVEQALGKFAGKALPANTIEAKLLQIGASKAEIKERGLTSLLESKGAKPVQPSELIKYLDKNPYQLKEVVKGGPPKNLRIAPSVDYPGEYDVRTIDTGRTLFSGRNEGEATDYIYGLKSPTKFHGYQTPGGENYREILMTTPVPTKKAQHLVGEIDTPDMSKAFSGGHWDEPNVVAHMRVNDRVLPTGEKALHVEEWQSDWASSLRKEKKSLTVEKTDRGWHVYDGDNEVAGPFPTRADADWLLGTTPAPPLVDNWQDLMARRTLKEAADGGYDRLTWTTGAQQADRYDLSKKISVVKLHDNMSGGVTKAKLEGPFSGGTISAWDLNGNKVMDDIYVGTEQKLAEHIGKDAAEKLLQSQGRNASSAGIGVRERNLSGLDLKVGGEWATKLYDESMVNRFNKIGKQYGVQVEKTDLMVEPTVTRQQLKIPGAGKQAVTVHSMKITPEMRKSIGATKFHPFADLPGPLNR